MKDYRFDNVHATKASYKETDMEEFRYNPLVEALPLPLGREETMQSLMVYPPYSESDRDRPYEWRMEATQRIISCHAPSHWDLDISTMVSRCMRWGYAKRNPLAKKYAATLAGNYNAMCDGSLNYHGGYHAAAQGFSIIGVSGVGKTTTVEAILQKYPQVIEHTVYEGIPFPVTQISWLKLDCPKDGSLKSLCIEFFGQVDLLVGTQYQKQNERRTTLDVMQIRMSQVCAHLNVGLLVIDEIQHLCASKKEASQAALNFFVSLSNTIGIPVVLIGTPSALKLLRHEFQQAKRGSGQGSILWGRTEQKSPNWDLYLKSVFRYQYTRIPVALTKEISDAIYDESQGLPFLASHLYKLTQEDAMSSGKESFDVKDIHRVADGYLGLTKPLRDAMRRGEDVDLNALEIASIHAKTWESAPADLEKTKAAVHTVPKESVHQDAVARLLLLGIAKKEAEEAVILVMGDMKENAPAELVARKAAMLCFQDSHTSKSQSKTNVPTGYDKLKESGMIASEEV